MSVLYLTFKQTCFTVIGIRRGMYLHRLIVKKFKSVTTHIKRLWPALPRTVSNRLSTSMITPWFSHAYHCTDVFLVWLRVDIRPLGNGVSPQRQNSPVRHGPQQWSHVAAAVFSRPFRLNYKFPFVSSRKDDSYWACAKPRRRALGKRDLYCACAKLAVGRNFFAWSITRTRFSKRPEFEAKTPNKNADLLRELDTVLETGTSFI